MVKWVTLGKNDDAIVKNLDYAYTVKISVVLHSKDQYLNLIDRKLEVTQWLDSKVTDCKY